MEVNVMAQISSLKANEFVFPFHHVTKVQMQGKERPSVQEGALPQIEVHYKTDYKIPSLKLPSLMEALQKYLQMPEIFRTRGSIIDILG